MIKKSSIPQSFHSSSSITPKTWRYFGSSWETHFKLGRYTFEPEGENHCQAYLSIKFDGPSYGGGSPQDLLTVDRIFVVREFTPTPAATTPPTPAPKIPPGPVTTPTAACHAVEILIPATLTHPREVFWVKARIYNPYSARSNVPLCVLLNMPVRY